MQWAILTLTHFAPNSISMKKAWSLLYYIWASLRENLSSVVCEHQRRRPACAYAQSDQHFCYSLIVKYHIKAWYKRNFNSLVSLCSWAVWFESRFVKNSKASFSRVMAHLRNVLWHPNKPSVLLSANSGDPDQTLKTDVGIDLNWLRFFTC